MVPADVDAQPTEPQQGSSPQPATSEAAPEQPSVIAKKAGKDQSTADNATASAPAPASSSDKPLKPP